ncbi:hypothetical protein C474_00662 [Halogeometricum pallidum JCM 14848]|uniref:Gins51 C-terminal domain-containing protein n=1 Tax=Halogeometricum pallidum JCM 14848 TaxID=1227487 RepID=M0DJD1_HALPD|nr:hypothetical protein [Halogeometricum pallidum]ELZ34827.1 hypothetical protein C474_00662 [Halogeometricum pallidum JCM 14848]
MDLDELRSVRRTERQKDSLQHLRDSFYGDVADYIAQQKAERKRAADRADDPFSDPDVGRLTDEIETAEDVVEAVYERRVGKVVKLASFAAADMSADTNGLTAEERDLFEDLVDRIKENRGTVLDVLAGKRSGAAQSSDSAPSEPVGPADEGPSPDAGVADPADDSSATRGTDEEAAADPTGDAPPAPPDLDPDAPAGGSGDVLADAMGGGEDGESEAGTGTAADAAPTAGDAADETPRDASKARDESQSTAADRPATEASAVVEDGAETEPTTETAGAEPGTGGEAGSETETDDADDTDRVTLRITRDVGQILGVDEREYDLATEDVVTLPATNAGPLVERGAAERLD